MGYQAFKSIETLLCCLHSDDNMKKCSNSQLFSWRNVRSEYRFTVIIVILELDYSVLVNSPRLFFYIRGFGTAFFLVIISSFKTFGILPRWKTVS